jgi:hypothetical protein
MSFRVKPGWVLVASLLVGGVAYGARRAWTSRAVTSATPAPPRDDRPPIPDSAIAPRGVRVRVQVLNASEQKGAARRATMYLRSRGFDVVGMGNVRPFRDSSLVQDHTGHAAWAGLVAAALGGARVEARPDTSRYLDVTVLLGRDWRPPPQPFNP